MTDRLALTFHALADPTRRRILERLQQGEASVQELTKPLPISQPAVSKHLKVLEQAGLVERRSDRQKRYARLRGKPLQEAIAYLNEYHRAWEENFTRLDGVLARLQAERPAVRGLGAAKPTGKLQSRRSKPPTS